MRSTSARRAPQRVGANRRTGPFVAANARQAKVVAYEQRKAWAAHHAPPKPTQRWCPECLVAVTVTPEGRLRRHDFGKPGRSSANFASPCAGSRIEAPPYGCWPRREGPQP